MNKSENAALLDFFSPITLVRRVRPDLGDGQSSYFPGDENVSFWYTMLVVVLVLALLAVLGICVGTTVFLTHLNGQRYDENDNVSPTRTISAAAAPPPAPELERSMCHSSTHNRSLSLADSPYPSRSIMKWSNRGADTEDKVIQTDVEASFSDEELDQHARPSSLLKLLDHICDHESQKQERKTGNQDLTRSFYQRQAKKGHLPF